MNTTDKQHTDPRHDPQRIVPTPADEALSVPRDRPEPADFARILSSISVTLRT